MQERSLRDLIAGGPVVLDGAWGTQLQARGLPAGACPDAWNLERPAAVEAVARSYVEAGSRIILSNTFGANRLVLARHGLADRAEAINQAGAAISLCAAGGRAIVAASVGPSGVLLAAGQVSRADLRSAFREQAEALAAGGATAAVVETMADPDEAAIAVEACVAAGLQTVCSFTFDSGRQRDRTMCGCTPEVAAQTARDAGAVAVGANCGLGPAALAPLIPRLASAGLPVWAKPNAGLPGGGCCTVDDLAALRAAGATLIGACCGSDPALIAGLAARLRAPSGVACAAI